MPLEAAEGDGGDATAAAGDMRGGRDRALGRVLWVVWGGGGDWGCTAVVDHYLILDITYLFLVLTSY